VFAVVLESVPAELGRKVSEALRSPTIGVGAGPHCDAQIMVWQDMAGLANRTSAQVRQALRRYSTSAGPHRARKRRSVATRYG
jgi:3-methyl-2-oxobutanoate hydroxymethyltransferase